MAIGIDTDTEYARRSSIPSGGAGSLSGGGFSDFFVGGWVYRDSAECTYGNTSDGHIISGVASAREIKLGYDNTFGAGTAADPLLQVIFNSGGGTGATQTFASANFLDEWVYYFFYENSSNDQVAGYIRLADLTTAVTISRANDNAGSQYVNTLTFGNESGSSACAAGHYAYARARSGSGITASDVLAWAADSAPVSGDWGFWALPNNTGNSDTSGNGRDLTFSSGLTSEADPDLSGGILADATDTNTPTDSAVAFTDRVVAANDTNTPTDSATSFTNRISTASDTNTPTDSAASQLSIVAAAADTSTPTDSAVAAIGFAATAADTNTPTDSAASQLSIVAAAVDTNTPTDSAASQLSVVASASDTNTPTDSAASQTDRVASASDTNTPTDSGVASVTAAGEAVASDTNTPTDSAAAVVSLVASANDTSVPTDSAVAVASLTVSASDTVSPTDSAAAATDRVATAEDTNTPTDSAVAALVDAGSVAADTVSFTDSAVALLDAIAAATDTVLFTDRATATRPAGAGGGRAWLRTWLQQKYGEDFELYAKQRRERELKVIAERAPAVARAPRPAQAAGRPVKVVPQERRVELSRLLSVGAARRPAPVALEIPAVAPISFVGTAGTAQRSSDLAPDEERMILEIARLLNL